MSKRRRFSPEFKQGAVDQVRRQEVSCAQVARELGLGANLLTRWVREADSGSGQAFAGAGTPRDAELTKLKRELARVTKERDFLRDAAAYFAKGSSSGIR